ncbi:MAG: hypothetical protein JRJ29_19740 [Deltaproteobacteria bacterium]|nr:hypothetical protein [Deltaproteobacteria bacterium]
MQPLSKYRQKSIFFVLLLLTLGVIGLLVYRHSTLAPRQETDQVSPRSGVSKSRMQIRGIQFTGYYRGKRVIAIRADQFAIEKKKIGFFRFGMMNVGRIRNAEIDIYGRKQEKKPKVRDTKKEKKQKPVNLDPSKLAGADKIAFGDVFRGESLASFGVKRLFSLVAEPVTLRLHDDREVVTEIRARSAEIRVRNRDILFKGDVRLKSEGRLLETDRLSLLPDRGMIRCPSRYLLRTPGKSLEGEMLVADIFLNVLTYGGKE